MEYLGICEEVCDWYCECLDCCPDSDERVYDISGSEYSDEGMEESS